MGKNFQGPPQTWTNISISNLSKNTKSISKRAQSVQLLTCPSKQDPKSLRIPPERSEREWRKFPKWSKWPIEWASDVSHAPPDWLPGSELFFRNNQNDERAWSARKLAENAQNAKPNQKKDCPSHERQFLSNYDEIWSECNVTHAWNLPKLCTQHARNTTLAKIKTCFLFYTNVIQCKVK